MVFTLLWSAAILGRPRLPDFRGYSIRPQASNLSIASPAREKTASTSLHQAALLVGELAALLRAGRSPEQMWRQAALSARRRLGDGGLDGSRKSARSAYSASSLQILYAASVLEAAARAAALGIPVARAIRDAASLAWREGFPAVTPSSVHGVAPAVFNAMHGLSPAISNSMGDPGSRKRPGGGRLRLREPRMLAVWLEVAACVEVAEASGCPLSSVFDRLSSHLESDADAAAARATALAGPKATTRILTVLPFGGLLLGTLIGADPLVALTSTAVGLVCLVGGVALALAGRLWSRRLVAQTGALR
ncbi:type II secretion system F family protein [Sinomonas humi]|uniref:type II secretion system F family protein n=1 Tax=Sinomonas humi TaxID=1338436 RepID=UPI0012E0B753|nr:hypothetical protein [Sinomonas humi]